jgi:serine/threonine protein phosphatase PrpC
MEDSHIASMDISLTFQHRQHNGTKNRSLSDGCCDEVNKNDHCLQAKLSIFGVFDGHGGMYC